MNFITKIELKSNHDNTIYSKEAIDSIFEQAKTTIVNIGTSNITIGKIESTDINNYTMSLNMNINPDILNIEYDIQPGGYIIKCHKEGDITIIDEIDLQYMSLMPIESKGEIK